VHEQLQLALPAQQLASNPFQVRIHRLFHRQEKYVLVVHFHLERDRELGGRVERAAILIVLQMVAKPLACHPTNLY